MLFRLNNKIKDLLKTSVDYFSLHFISPPPETFTESTDFNKTRCYKDYL